MVKIFGASLVNCDDSGERFEPSTDDSSLFTASEALNCPLEAVTPATVQGTSGQQEIDPYQDEMELESLESDEDERTDDASQFTAQDALICSLEAVTPAAVQDTSGQQEIDPYQDEMELESQESDEDDRNYQEVDGIFQEAIEYARARVANNDDNEYIEDEGFIDLRIRMHDEHMEVESFVPPPNEEPVSTQEPPVPDSFLGTLVDLGVLLVSD